MKITAITSLKNGELYRCLKEANTTQADVATYCEVRQTEISEILNFKRVPKNELIIKMWKYFHKKGVDLKIDEAFPSGLKCLKSNKKIQTEDIPIENMIEYDERLMLTAAVDNDSAIMEEEYSNIEKIFSTFTAMETDIIKSRYGLDGCSIKTGTELAEKYNLSKTRIYQIEWKLLRHMRGWISNREYFALRLQKLGIKTEEEALEMRNFPSRDFSWYERDDVSVPAPKTITEEEVNENASRELQRIIEENFGSVQMRQ